MNTLRNSVRLIGYVGDIPKIKKFDNEKSDRKSTRLNSSH